MDARFEDHGSFQRAAAAFAIGGAALGAAGSLQLAAAGSALALLVAGGNAGLRRRAVAACCCATIAVAWILVPVVWAGAACGAMLGLLLAVVRSDTAAGVGATPPSPAAVALCAALSASAQAAAAVTLPYLSAALATVAPPWIAAGLSGGAMGLWTALAAAPLHVRLGGDALERRLAALRTSLDPELGALAERAMAARRGAAIALAAVGGAELGILLDSLTAAALDLAARAAELSRAAAPALEDDLQRRSAQLARTAGSAEDPSARQSYLRAADALSSQLEHFRRVRRARERVLASLHEDVANLERARFSLTLLDGAGGAVELQLLHERLRQGVTVFEETAEVAAPSRARA